jgi:hypothetical protein
VIGCDRCRKLDAEYAKRAKAKKRKAEKEREEERKKQRSEGAKTETGEPTQVVPQFHKKGPGPGKLSLCFLGC